MLSTSPDATGSPTPTKTIGITLVAFLAARAAGVVVVTSTSTLRRTHSPAMAGKPVKLSLSIARFESYVLAFYITEFAHLLPGNFTRNGQAGSATAAKGTEG
jgi:hypothetical protein